LLRRQHFLKPVTGTAGAQIVASEFFNQFFLAVNFAAASFDVRFGRITFTPFARWFVESILYQIVLSWP